MKPNKLRLRKTQIIITEYCAQLLFKYFKLVTTLPYYAQTWVSTNKPSLVSEIFYERRTHDRSTADVIYFFQQSRIILFLIHKSFFFFKNCHAYENEFDAFV